VLIDEDDLGLSLRIEGDSEMMSHLGGPRTKEQIAEVHQRRLDLMARGEAFMYKILLDDSDEPEGSIGMWEKEWNGANVHEMGWMILPEFQGKGLAATAGRMILDRARSDPRFTVIHAFPAVDNAASNAICRKLGFENQGELEFEFAGRTLRCNDWRLDLRQAGAST
jgi:RimJ/RimL family protein N-acetyltransferase